MGMGKSGHVGRKIAATLASTGTPAFFVHPAEASHGDLGMITRDDVVLAFAQHLGFFRQRIEHLRDIDGLLRDLRLRFQARKASRITSLLEAYSPPSTASRR